MCLYLHDIITILNMIVYDYQMNLALRKCIFELDARCLLTDYFSIQCFCWDMFIFERSDILVQYEFKFKVQVYCIILL